MLISLYNGSRMSSLAHARATGESQSISLPNRPSNGCRRFSQREQGSHFDTMTSGNFYLKCAHCHAVSRLAPTLTTALGGLTCSCCRQPASSDSKVLECSSLLLRAGTAELPAPSDGTIQHAVQCCRCETHTYAPRSYNPYCRLEVVSFTQVDCRSCGHTCCLRCPRFELCQRDVFAAATTAINTVVSSNNGFSR